MSAAQYNEIIGLLEEAGASNFAGRTYHFCYGSDERLFVTDVYDSPESFEEFGRILMPILQKFGFDPGEPKIYEIKNSII